MRIPFLIHWYEKVLKWSTHPKAPYYLGLVSFVDASLFPISPLFMILPMSFAAPHRAFFFASIAIFASFFGGIVGYTLGYFAFEAIVGPFIEFMGYENSYLMAMEWFDEWGFWAILVGCVTPVIPYKIFTIGSGVMQLNFGWFLVASLLGRSIRFLLIATIIRCGGPKFEPFLRRVLVKIGD